MNNDHREDIIVYYQDLVEDMHRDLRGTNPEGEELYDNVLEVTHTSTHDDTKPSGLTPHSTRLLITCGGPTVHLTYYHHRQYAELYHSWGRNHFGDDMRTYDSATSDVQTIEDWIETFTPHPTSYL